VTPYQRMAAFSAAGLIVAPATGIGLTAAGHKWLGWRLSLAAADDVGPRDSAAGGHGQASDGTVAGQRRRWVGSASVPGGVGYVEIGVLLAVAEVGVQSLVLRIRPGIIRLMFGIENLTVQPGAGVAIFPARKLGQSGIEVRIDGRQSYYFWTGQRVELLATLAAAGFAVSDEEQRTRRLRRVRLGTGIARHLNAN
jgi:hypothetical protein